MSSSDNKDLSSVFRFFSLVSQVGFQFVITLLIGLFLGYKLDQWLGTRFVFTLLGIIAGIGGGFLSVYQLIRATERRGE